MPTVNQLTKNKRKKKKTSSKSRHLDKSPQKRGVLVSVIGYESQGGKRVKVAKPAVYVVKPKKPNSANRKCCRVRLSNGEVVIAYIPGKDHNLQEHSDVLIRGGRVKDLPGVRYKVVRGKLSCAAVKPESFGDGTPMPRNQGRSKYGVKKEKGKK